MRDIDNLPFPDTNQTNPRRLAMENRQRLVWSNSKAAKKASLAGVFSLTNDVFHYGYGDRHFTPLVAGGIGLEINHHLRDKDIIKQDLSLSDYGKMFQTGWFGQILNQTALTRQGVIQPHFEQNYTGTGPEDSIFNGNLNPDGYIEPYQTMQEPESGLAIVGLTRAARVVLSKARSFNRYDGGQSVGCPVARTSFLANDAQLDLLETHGHIGENSGFYAEEDLTASGLHKVSQGAYTAIDDVLWQWGDYVSRYTKFQLAIGQDPHGLEATDANQYILLD